MLRIRVGAEEVVDLEREFILVEAACAVNERLAYSFHPRANTLPSMNKPTASTYLPQLSPTAALRLVYKGSRSMRWAALLGFCALMEDGSEAPLIFDVFRGCSTEVAMESDLLRAAGLMSGIVQRRGVFNVSFSGMHLAELCAFGAASNREHDA